jgi:predicted phosphodiesterase
MKIAVFSDVQGNLPAMQAAVEHILDWHPELVIMNGDLVNRGPNSAACLNLFEDLRRQENWLPIRGNHEDFVLHCASHPPTGDFDAAMRRFTDWTVRQLGESSIALEGWPDHLCLQGTGDNWMHLTHGSMLGNRDGISPSMTDQALAERIPLDVALFVVAHTHKPLRRVCQGVDILNIGSVGSPFDGDVRASYARIEQRHGKWKTHIVRLAYERKRSRDDFEDSAFIDQGGPLARLIFEEWQRAQLLIPRLLDRYEKAMRQGEITLEQAVERFLGSLDEPP